MTTVALPALIQERTRPIEAGLQQHRFVAAATALAIAVVAVGIRLWGLGATMASSDQVAMAWLVRHSYGFKWIFAHDYGPVLPLIQRTWAELLCRLHVPIDEAAVRVPIALASLLQVALTFALMRRLRCSRTEAGLGSLVCAIIPSLVSDAHYAWGYNTIWLLTGTAALWATLSWLNEDRPGWLLLGGTALLLHCLSNCFAFASPIALLYVWSRAARTRRRQAALHRSPSLPLLRGFMVGFVLPCLAALLVIGVSYKWTGAGQLGRLAFKRAAGSTGLQTDQFLQLPAIWASHFGYAFAVPAALGLAWATFSMRFRGLAVWCWASLLPMLLLVDWDRVGYPASYLIESAYAAGMLGVIGICAAYRLVTNRPLAGKLLGCSAAIALAHMGIASVDACLGGARLAAWTGVPITWGSVRAETGIKAAGWYVREHVPPGAIVMAAHTNNGMEAPVAEYYCGRAVLADYDLRPEAVETLISEMHASVDVLIVEPTWRQAADALSGFEQAAVIRHEGRPVRYVYARRELHLPRVESQASVLNSRYDTEYRSSKVPQPLTAPPAFDAQFERYQKLSKQLRMGAARVSR